MSSGSPKPTMTERLAAVKRGLEGAVDRGRTERLERAAARGRSADADATPVRLTMRFAEEGLSLRGRDAFSERIAETLGQETARTIYDALRTRSLRAGSLREVNMPALMKALVSSILGAMHPGTLVEWED